VWFVAVINLLEILLEMNSEPITEINVTYKCDVEAPKEKITYNSDRQMGI
jgi:hypothetical protein